MTSHYKVTSNQVMWLFATMEFGTTVLLTFTGTIRYAGQDAWLAAILAGAASLLIAMVAIRLAAYFPDQTLAEYSRLLFGKWVAKLIVLSYIVMLLLMIPVILREGTDFITIALLQQTPTWVVAALICLPSFYLIMSGLKALARCCEVIGPIVYALLLILLLVLVKDINLHHLLPVYTDSGAGKIMRGSVYMTGFLSESVLVLLLPPFLKESGKEKRRGFLIGLMLAWLFLTLFLIIVLTIFGPDLSAKMWYPAYGAVRYISIGGFVERVDPVGVLIWLYCMVIKFSLFIWIASYNLSTWLHLKRWKTSVWFILPAGFAGSLFPHNVITTLKHFTDRIWIPWLFPVNLVLLPLLLWAAAAIRKRKQAPRANQPPNSEG